MFGLLYTIENCIIGYYEWVLSGHYPGLHVLLYFSVTDPFQ